MYIEEGFYYLCSENKGADQLRSYHEADLRLYFRICKSRFSHDAAHMSLVRKPACCICENKGADQLGGNREADQRLCFRYKVQFLAILCACTAWFVPDLVGNPEDRFSHNEAHINFSCFYMCIRNFKNVYQNDPKFSDRQVRDNSADPDQTAPRGEV